MDKQQKLLRLLKLEEIIQDGDTAIARFLFKLEDKLDEVYNNIDEIQKEQGEPGADGHTPTEEELLELIKPLIPEVESGKTPNKDELLALIKPLIPQVKDGKTPTKSELLEIIKPLIPKIDEDSVIQKAVKIVQDSLPSVDELIDNVEKRLPSLSEPIRDALELLKDEDRLDAKHIHGLDTYYNDTFKTFARKEDVHVISTNKPLSEMVDVNVQGLQVNDSIKWNGREWVAYTPIEVETQNLQKVTDIGATTTNDITVGGIIVSKGVVLGYKKVEVDYNLTNEDYTVECVNSITITLPESNQGQTFNIKNIGTSLVTVRPSGSELIDSQSQQTLLSYDSMKIQGTGTGWIII